MLKLVGTGLCKVLDEKVIITDDGKLTKFAIKLICAELLADIAIFIIISKIAKLIKK